MDGQISLADYQMSLSYDRRGRTVQAPAWVKPRRCENCVYWDIDPEYDQPPDGWGVYGLCNHLHEGERHTQKTGHFSCCQDWRSKFE